MPTQEYKLWRRGTERKHTADYDFVREVTGTANPTLQAHFLEQLNESIWMPDDISDQLASARLHAAARSLEEIKPQGAAESMLAVQMVGTHNAAMECLRRAMLPEQAAQARDQELKHAAKLLGLYARQLEALDKHRGKGQQKVTVEYVHVGAGGQAIVGHVEANGRRSRSRAQCWPAGSGSESEGSDAKTVASCTPSSAPPVRTRVRQ